MSEASAAARRGRAIVAGGVALVLAIGAAVLVVSSGGGGAGPGTARSAGPGAAAPGPSVLPAPRGDAASAPAGAEAAGAAVAVSAQVTDAGAGAAAGTGWNDVRLAARLSDLGPLAPDVYRGLQRARAALEPCYRADDADQAAHPRAQGGEDAWGAAIVTLQLEGRPGELVVVNAPLQELGSSAMSLVECAEGVLRGFRIPSKAAVPGERHRLQYQLTP